MSQKFQLSNNTFFYTNKNILINSKGDEVCLENLESKVLQLFIDSIGDVVSKEALMTCWKTGAYTSDNSITRVISKIRSKLNEIDDSNSIEIKNVRKKGYMLLTNIVNSQISHTEMPDNISTDNHRNYNNTYSYKFLIFFKRIYNVYIVSFVLIVFTIYAVSSLSSSEQPIYTSYLQPYNLFEDSMRKFELSANESGDVIVFSGQRMDSSQWLLGIYNDVTKKIDYIERDGADLTTPTWLSDKSLAIRVKNNENCWIELITIDDLISKNKGQNITKCYPQSPTFSMAKLSKNELLIADSPAISKGSHLTKLNILSGVTEFIHKDNNGGAGIYKVIQSENRAYLALLKTNDWVNTHIDIVAKEDINTVLWSEDLAFPLFSLAFFNDRIIYKSDRGGIVTHHFNNNFEVINSEYLPLFMPFDSITRFKDDIIFTKGELYSQNIYLYDRVSHLTKELSNRRSERNYLPYRFNDDEVWYVSNKSGLTQLWSVQLSSGKSSQLSFFERPLEVNTIDISHANNLLLIDTNEGAFVFNYNKIMKEPLFVLEGHYPIFYQNKIIYTKKEGDTYNLFSYDLTTKEIEKITYYGGYRAKTDGELLYFDKYNKPGIWQLKNSVEVLSYVLDDHPIRWAVDKNNLYIFSKEKVVNIKNKTLLRVELSEKSCLNARQINESICLNVVNDNIPNQVVVLPKY